MMKKLILMSAFGVLASAPGANAGTCVATNFDPSTQSNDLRSTEFSCTLDAGVTLRKCVLTEYGNLSSSFFAITSLSDPESSVIVSCNTPKGNTPNAGTAQNNTGDADANTSNGFFGSMGSWANQPQNLVSGKNKGDQKGVAAPSVPSNAQVQASAPDSSGTASLSLGNSGPSPMSLEGMSVKTPDFKTTNPNPGIKDYSSTVGTGTTNTSAGSPSDNTFIAPPTAPQNLSEMNKVVNPNTDPSLQGMKENLNGKQDSLQGIPEKTSGQFSETSKIPPPPPVDKEEQAAAKTDMNKIDVRANNDKDYYCGRYGGRDCENTKAINAGVKGGIQLASQVGTIVTQSQGASATTNLSSQGMTASMAHYYHAQADLARKAARTSNGIGSGEAVMALGQSALIYAHLNSRKAVTASADAGYAYYGCKDGVALDNPEENLSGIPDLKLRQAKCDIITENKKAERKAQSQFALVQAAETAQTGGAAALMKMNAQKAWAVANSLDKDAAMVAGTPVPFVYKGPTPVTNNSNAPMAAATPDSAAVTTPDNSASPTLNDPTINPNLGDNSPQGPAPGAFANSPPGSAPAGGGSGVGGAGGTSAARDDAKPDQNAIAGKSQTGGNYAAGDGGFKGRSGGAGGAAVGVDPNFSDLLKKLLDGAQPTADTGKGVDPNAMGDRTPASDAAAVIPRTKNIFEEIHKRYVKKNGEGAIVFVEGQS